MSLPPTLLQRLAQRGILQNNAKLLENQVNNEEIIAEDYDEPYSDPSEEDTNDYAPSKITDDKKKKNSDESFWLQRIRERARGSYAGFKFCPNKYNVWHKCTLYCVKRWENGRPEPTEKYLRRYKRLLQRYPLPEGWVDVYDAGCGAYYFSNMEDNLVSWLPPTHPKAQVTQSAAAIRKQLDNTNDDSQKEQDQGTIKQGDGSNKAFYTTPYDAHESSYGDTQTLKKPKNRDIEKAISRKRKDRMHSARISSNFD